MHFVKNDEIISALTGTVVEPPFFDPKKKRKTVVGTVIGYLVVGVAAYFIAGWLPETPVGERLIDLPGLVFVFEPGPGGGGGGGGEDSLEPPSVQQIEGQDQALVAVNVDVPEDELIYDDPDKPNYDEVDEEEVAEEPEVEAPVVAQAPDEIDQAGLLEGLEQLLESAGSGTDGGAGSGLGTGIGEGEGAGIGEGTGGGFGGGAYRPGSGVSPPQLRKQVKPAYTDEALARKIEGLVVLEVVVLKDGNVGPVRILRSLNAGLDQRAIEAVQQWVFLPGRLQGQPVDVRVEIDVVFSLL